MGQKNETGREFILAALKTLHGTGTRGQGRQSSCGRKCVDNGGSREAKHHPKYGLEALVSEVVSNPK